MKGNIEGQQFYPRSGYFGPAHPSHFFGFPPHRNLNAMLVHFSSDVIDIHMKAKQTFSPQNLRYQSKMSWPL